MWYTPRGLWGGGCPGGREQERVMMEVRRHWPREAWAWGKNGQERRMQMGKKARGGEPCPEERWWEGVTLRALDSCGRASGEASS